MPPAVSVTAGGYFLHARCSSERMDAKSAACKNDVMEADQKRISIYYDGTCRLCSGIIEKIEHSSRREIFEALDTSDHLPEGITHDAALHEVYAVDGIGKMHSGSAAVLFILSQYPRWRWLAAVGSLPLIKQIAALFYRVVADNRHRL
jgi:predicted DCC family thiol-disulfide oxidoreductase YuxK